MNAYEMINLLRDNIGEAEAAHWSDRLLLLRLNAEQLEVGRFMLDSPGDYLMKKSTALTPVLSLITLPGDCVRPAYLEEVGSGRVIPIRGTIRERRLTRQPGTTLQSGTIEAHFFGDYLEVNKSSYGEPVYLWYQRRIVDLHTGVCGTGTGAAAVVFQAANWPSGVDDYYNDIVIQVRDVSNHLVNVNQAIADYDGGTFTAVIDSPAADPASGDFYGTVSVLPPELHNYILLRATVRALARPSSTFEKELFGFWRAELKTAKEEAEEFLASRLSGSTYTRITEM